MSFRLACVQLNVGDDIAANTDACLGFIRAAARDGAAFIATPENTGCMVAPGSSAFAKGFAEADHPALARYRDAAKELGVWLLIGSLWIAAQDGKRVANRQFLIAPDGGIVGRYDKIHMFDVDLANGEQYRESRSFAPGDRAVVSDTPFGRLGHSICYDLRFPHLYRALAHAGAEFISVPAAFTRTTGMAHWHVLLRARAIETGAYVFAPAQCGTHPGDRLTYGHALIVAPWGEILADAGEAPGFVAANLDLAEVARVRASVPAWRADAAFASPALTAARAAE